jgi:polysaccharide export outer membrane protein
MMSRRLVFPIAVLVLLALTLPAPSQETETAPPPSPVKGFYTVGAGDILRVVVWKNPDLSGECLVRPDGIITLPLVGDVLAGGMITDGIGLQIERKLKYFIEAPMVTVSVVRAGSSQVFILGEVARPGAYPLPGPFTLLQAIAEAGGFTPFADRTAITLLRREGDKQVSYRYRFNDLVAGGDKGKYPLLGSGDTLIVP